MLHFPFCFSPCLKLLNLEWHKLSFKCDLYCHFMPFHANFTFSFINILLKDINYSLWVLVFNNKCVYPIYFLFYLVLTERATKTCFTGEFVTCKIAITLIPVFYMQKNHLEPFVIFDLYTSWWLNIKTWPPALG